MSEVRHLGKNFLTNITCTDFPVGLHLVLHTCSNEGNQDNDLTILLWLRLIVNKWKSQGGKNPIFRFSLEMGHGVQATIAGIARLIFCLFPKMSLVKLIFLCSI